MNANNRLSAFVIQEQRHLAIVFLSCFCAANPIQMHVLMILAVHISAIYSKGNKHSVVFFYSIYGRMQVLLGTGAKC